MSNHFGPHGCVFPVEPQSPNGKNINLHKKWGFRRFQKECPKCRKPHFLRTFYAKSAVFCAFGHSFPRDPSILKILRTVNFGTGRKFGAEVAKRYGEGSEMLVFLGEKDRKTVQIVKNYGGSKILRIRAPYYF